MLNRLRWVLSGYWARFVALAGAGIILNVALATVDPLITKTLVDEGLMKADFRVFTGLALIVLAFGVFVRVGMWVYELLAQRLRNDITESLSVRMLRHFYGIEFAETLTSESGYFLSFIYDEPAKIAQGVVATWIGLSVQCFTFCAAMAVSLHLAWQLTVALSVVVPLLYYLAGRFRPHISRASKAEHEHEARLRDTVASAVAAYTTVRVFGLHDAAASTIRRRLRSFLSVLYARVRTSKSYQMMSSICLSMAEAIVLLAAGYGVVTSHLTIGGLFGFMSAFWKLIGAANAIIGQVPELSKLDAYAQRLQDFAARARLAELPDYEHITVDGATAGYQGREVLKDFNLRIGPNEKVLIVGPNGSGKSTLAYLVTGMLAPMRGAVQSPRLRRISALLTPFHFLPGTLKDNVDYEHLNEDTRRLFWALVDDFGLRDKVDDEPNLAYSEGQKKKAQVVMTLLKDADIYIFDEPLANVDSASKGKIVTRQVERAAGRTLIAIVHGDEELYGRFERVVRLE